MRRPPIAYVAPGCAHLVKSAKLQGRLDVRASVVEDPRLRPGMMIVFPHFRDMVEAMQRVVRAIASALRPLFVALQDAARALSQFFAALSAPTPARVR